MNFPTQEHITAANDSAEYWYAQKGVYSFPSFRLAQTAIESAEGKALSGLNNYWGVKANKAQIAAGQYKVCKTHEVINGKTIAIMDKFASYTSLEEGYIEQAKLLVTSPYYEKSRHDNNPKQYAIDVAVHYATAPNYAKVIIDYMDKHNLYQYDHPDHAPVGGNVVNVNLKPPAHLEKKAQDPATAGGTVLVGTAVAMMFTGPHLAVMGVGIALTLACAAVAFYRYRQAHKTLATILTPPTEAEKAEVLAQVSASKIEPVAAPAKPEDTPPVLAPTSHQ